MISIKQATEKDVGLLAGLCKETYIESHGHFIDDKNDLTIYTETAFSESKTKQDLNDTTNLFHIVYVNEKPAGYSKLVRNETQEHVASTNCCRLERIYVLREFIPLKIGQQLMDFVVEKSKALQFDTLWLSVYIKNKRAIKFYEKNGFLNVGDFNFLVNGKSYENIVFAKKI